MAKYYKIASYFNDYASGTDVDEITAEEFESSRKPKVESDKVYPFTLGADKVDYHGHQRLDKEGYVSFVKLDVSPDVRLVHIVVGRGVFLFTYLTDEKLVNAEGVEKICDSPELWEGQEGDLWFRINND